NCRQNQYMQFIQVDEAAGRFPFFPYIPSDGGLEIFNPAQGRMEDLCAWLLVNISTVVNFHDIDC
ncbi:MAG: hypothetical protein LBC48_06625, partial [Dysgonamonadaceae bacterium]|nr:hypothetical protein [Dysgonamonadaceae bacterium]